MIANTGSSSEILQRKCCANLSVSAAKKTGFLHNGNIEIILTCKYTKHSICIGDNRISQKRVETSQNPGQSQTVNQSAVQVQPTLTGCSLANRKNLVCVGVKWLSLVLSIFKLYF